MRPIAVRSILGGAGRARVEVAASRFPRHHVQELGLDVLTILKVLWQRWYIVVPFVVITLVVTAFVGSGIEPTYAAEGSMLLRDGQSDSSATTGASADSGIDGDTESVPVSTVVLAERAQTGEVRRELTRNGQTDYVVTAESDGIIRVEASGASADQAVKTARRVLNRLAALAEDEGGQARIVNKPADAEIGGEGSGVGGSTGGNGTAAQRYVAVGSVYVTVSLRGGNPYGADAYTAKILEQVMLSPEVRKRATEGGRSAEYDVSLDSRDPAPLMYVTVNGPDANGVMTTYERVISEMQAELKIRQDELGVGPARQTTLETLLLPTSPDTTSGGKLRTVVAILGVGLFAAVSLTLLVDSILTRRREGAAASDVDGAVARLPLSTPNDPVPPRPRPTAQPRSSRPGTGGPTGRMTSGYGAAGRRRRSSAEAEAAARRRPGVSAEGHTSVEPGGGGREHQ